MSLPQVVSRQEWEVARKALLEAEKEMTRAHDELNTKRRELPMVKIEEDYTFEGLDGTASLLDLFLGRRQLIIRHFMFDPSWDEGCPSCTAASDEVSDGLLATCMPGTPPSSPSPGRLSRRSRHTGFAKAGGFPGTRRTAATSTTTSTSPWTSRWPPSSSTTGTSPSSSRSAWDGYRKGRPNNRATVCSSVMETTSSTRIPCLPGGRKRSAVRTTSSISPRSDGRRDGRNRKVVFPTPTVPDPISPHEPSRSTGGRRVILHACDQEQYRHRGKTV
jgi:Bacterial protein of unknown function (DUF899)